MLKASVAILPPDNMSDYPKQEYFSNSIADELIADFSKIPGLIVIAPNSAFAFVKFMN
jgi:TolB-like protein